MSYCSVRRVSTRNSTSAVDSRHLSFSSTNTEADYYHRWVIEDGCILADVHRQTSYEDYMALLCTSLSLRVDPSMSIALVAPQSPTQKAHLWRWPLLKCSWRRQKSYAPTGWATYEECQRVWHARITARVIIPFALCAESRYGSYSRYCRRLGTLRMYLDS